MIAAQNRKLALARLASSGLSFAPRVLAHKRTRAAASQLTGGDNQHDDHKAIQQKLKLPATAAIKHDLLVMQLEKEIRTHPEGCKPFDWEQSPALIGLKKLRKSPP